MTLLNKLKSISLSFLYKRALQLENNDPKFIAMGMAGSLLFELYGRKWMSKQILNKNNLLFMIGKASSPLDQLKLQKEILLLGESLFNLREIEGIQNVLKMLKNCNVESILAELESGKLLYHRGLNFSYITRNLKKRKDFDIQIMEGPINLFCETKCKIDATIYSKNSYYNSLHKAKQQLPKNSPAIILIKIPYTWAQHEIELREIAATFVIKSKRPLGVVCWYDRWIKVDNTYTLNLTDGFEEHNIKSKIHNSRLIPILPNTQNSPHWKSFEQFANGYL